MAAHGNERSGSDDALSMERVVARDNVEAALKRVQKNKGSPGIDAMTVHQLPQYLATTWEATRAQLLAGTYRPMPVRRHAIPKKGGGVRELGIPTVVDRLIQQCILQVLQPKIDPTFSTHSYGFRPGRSAHDAVRAAHQFIQDGRTWVVDVDLEKFFDRVNHDILMGRLARRIADKRILGLVRKYLQAGVMMHGVVVQAEAGTPQGGPLSPMLANILLDEIDKELERRGHAFCRYADDLNVYVRSKRAGDDVLQTLRHLFAKLRLRINESKSGVARPRERKFLGYSFWSRGRTVKRRVAPQALATMQENVRRLTRRNRGRSMAAVVAELRQYLLGWKAYFLLAETPHAFARLDSWIHHRLRCLQLKHWKNGATIARELRARGLPAAKADRIARNFRSWWKSSGLEINVALPTRVFAALGLPRLGP